MVETRPCVFFFEGFRLSGSGQADESDLGGEHLYSCMRGDLTQSTFVISVFSIFHQEAKTLSTQQDEIRIPAGALTGGGQVRVRVKPEDKGHWSSWSPITSWVEAGDRLDLSDDEGTNMTPEVVHWFPTN